MTIESWIAAWLIVTAASPHLTEPQDTAIEVPHGSLVVVDGSWNDEEWMPATERRTADGRIALNHADGYLQIGLQTPSSLVASLCVQKGDTVHVFHASSALGRATYVRQDGEWSLIEGFEWRLRRTDLSAAAARERSEHRARFGWVASTAGMGTAGQTEMQIDTMYLSGDDARLAVGLLVAGDEPEVSGWPQMAAADGCTSRAVIAGPLPDRVLFMPERWVRLRRQTSAG